MAGPDLSYLDVQPVLNRLGDVSESLVLIGGQALNFWVDYYSGRRSDLQSKGLASKDVDFCGDKRAVRLCAERLNGEARFPSIDDATPNTGVVLFLDEKGVQRRIDFVDAPFGLARGEVERLAIPVELLSPAGEPTGVLFKVMHPVLTMESRVHNTMSLPGYDRKHSIEQLKASVVDRARVPL